MCYFRDKAKVFIVRDVFWPPSVLSNVAPKGSACLLKASGLFPE